LPFAGEMLYVGLQNGVQSDPDGVDGAQDEKFVEIVLLGRVHGLGRHTPSGVENTPKVQTIAKEAFWEYEDLHTGEQVAPDAVELPQGPAYSVETVSGGEMHGLGVHVPLGVDNTPALHVCCNDCEEV
jgi:hypothetical protein